MESNANGEEKNRFATAIFITSIEESDSIVRDAVYAGDGFLIHGRIHFLSRRSLKIDREKER